MESAKAPLSLDEDPKLPAVASSPPTSLPPLTLSPSLAAISSVLPFQSPGIIAHIGKLVIFGTDFIEHVLIGESKKNVVGWYFI